MGGSVRWVMEGRKRSGAVANRLATCASDLRSSPLNTGQMYHLIEPVRFLAAAWIKPTTC